MIDVSTVNINTLPRLPLASRHELPDCAAVYLAISHRNGDVLYIGRAKSLNKRWQSHHRIRQFEAIGDVYLAWLILDNDLTLARTEKALIERLAPRYNSTSIPYDLGRTVSCHIRFPKDLYAWLETKAQNYRSIQEKIIEVARQAQSEQERRISRTA